MIALIGAFGIGIIVGVFIGVIIYAVANETFSIDLSKPHNDYDKKTNKMAETLEITRQAAIKAHDEASSKGKTLLENLFGKRVFQKDIKERIKTFDDVIRELGDDPEEFKNAISIMDEPDEIAYVKLKLIAEALNEGWTPNWSNGEFDKWYPWFDMDVSSSAGRFSFCGSGHLGSFSNVGSRLCFKSEALADYAGTQFLELYRELFVIE